MSYQEQAAKINIELKNVFNSIPFREFNQEQREHILNLMIRIGQIAKFRCRNNTAYDNFIGCCFNEICKLQRVPIEDGSDYKILKSELIINQEVA